jgi:hypothetical protein
VSEANANYVCGEGLIIATFRSSLHIAEIEEFFNMNERSFILFEMSPGLFSAALNNEKFQKALFGGPITNVPNNYIYDMPEGIKEFIESIKEDLISDYSENKEIIPTLNDLLDKIGRVGIDNLTNKDKQYLNDYSNKNKI